MDAELYALILESGGQTLMLGRDVSSDRLMYFVMMQALIASGGALLAFVLALFIGYRRRWFWMNSLIAYLLLYGLGWVPWKLLAPVQQAVRNTYRLFSDNAIFFCLAGGALLVAAGTLLLLHRGLKRWIDRGYRFPAPVREQAPHPPS
ncbi:MAG TPA: hypothetical protein VHK69_08085 [Chitinophagaceae bacterium]|nr:hypothetical protein [Chitinophagaceae bacterium]